ncbi:head GIN domain-containing protein [Flavisericum labens]|uniref:head GIN domain-containing protein n=1 Tax=Flavisericum labens TaxID=3377112 RepID=UPI00387B1EC3
MKKLFYILCSIVLFCCNSENAGDCFQTTGEIIQKEVVLATFNKVLVNRDVELIVIQGAEQNVVIESGENLMNDVSAEVIDGQLILTDNNTCNYVRDYGATKVFVTSPNINEIRSSSQYDVSSNGILTYPNLTILSEDFGAPNTFTIGDFRLQIDNNSFSVVFNNLSVCHISGETDNLSVLFAAGNSRFEGRNLIAQKVYVNNRSSNDMIVNPQQEIKGTIKGVGNIILVNEPPLVDVEELYKGRLIFE